MDGDQYILLLEERIKKLEAELQCFFTGNIPDGATISQHVLAKWGRKRLDEIHTLK